MRPILCLMIMRRHNQTIHNQCAFGHSVTGKIAMKVLWGVVIAQNFCHIENGAAPPNSCHHTLLRSHKHTMCDPFDDRQMVVLVGAVLVVAAAPIVAVDRISSGRPTMGGFSLKLGAFSERGTLPRSSKKLWGCT